MLRFFQISYFTISFLYHVWIIFLILIFFFYSLELFKWLRYAFLYWNVLLVRLGIVARSLMPGNKHVNVVLACDNVKRSKLKFLNIAGCSKLINLSLIKMMVGWQGKILYPLVFIFTWRRQLRNFIRTALLRIMKGYFFTEANVEYTRYDI